MDSTRRTSRSTLRRVAMMAALAALLAPATAAEAKKTVKKPVVTKVTPMKASIGETLTIHGRYFRRGKARNSVVFQRQGAKAVFVVADVSTTKQIRVILPRKLAGFLVVKDGVPGPTKFRVRVLASRFGKSFTPVSKSPTIGPELPPAPPAPPVAAADGDCDGDNVVNGLDADDDNDLLGDDVEGALKLDGCKRDTDADGVEDGFEYQSARDLNDDVYQNPNASLPYPSKRPYANPLFADASSDYDGDGLWLLDEFRLWVAHCPRALGVMCYSDGKQYSQDINTVGYVKQGQFLQKAAASGYPAETLLNMDAHTTHGPDGWMRDQAYDHTAWYGGSPNQFLAPNPAITDVERYYYDLDLDGKLSDDERDEDADGLSNWVESHGFMTPGWWQRIYSKEKPFVNAYAGTDLADADSDGDGIVDGADDQDHDDIPNVRETRRQLVSGEMAAGVLNVCTFDDQADQYVTFVLGQDPKSVCWNRPSEGTKDDPFYDRPWRGFVNPFNPCLPNTNSRTCERYPNLEALYAPFEADTPIFKVVDSMFANPE